MVDSSPAPVRSIWARAISMGTQPSAVPTSRNVAYWYHGKLSGERALAPVIPLAKGGESLGLGVEWPEMPRIEAGLCTLHTKRGDESIPLCVFARVQAFYDTTEIVWRALRK